MTVQVYLSRGDVLTRDMATITVSGWVKLWDKDDENGVTNVKYYAPHKLKRIDDTDNESVITESAHGRV